MRNRYDRVSVVEVTVLSGAGVERFYFNYSGVTRDDVFRAIRSQIKDPVWQADVIDRAECGFYHVKEHPMRKKTDK